jgi:hypothetical protein
MLLSFKVFLRFDYSCFDKLRNAKDIETLRRIDCSNDYLWNVISIALKAFEEIHLFAYDLLIPLVVHYVAKLTRSANILDRCILWKRWMPLQL